MSWQPQLTGPEIDAYRIGWFAAFANEASILPDALTQGTYPYAGEHNVQPGYEGYARRGYADGVAARAQRLAAEAEIAAWQPEPKREPSG